MAEVPSKRRLILLQLLAADGGWMTGGDLLAADESMPRGTIYTTLQRMEKEGLVKSRTSWDAEGPRRSYQITGLGERMRLLGEIAEQVRAGKKFVPVAGGGV